MRDAETGRRISWSSAWPDGLAFGAGLALAWSNQGQTRDLVWSLWLPSLLVGYAMIVRSIFGTGVFTVYFGGFHFGHPIFLNSFLPMRTDTPRRCAPPLSKRGASFALVWLPSGAGTMQ